MTSVIDAADAVVRFERSTHSFIDALGPASEREWRLRPAGEEWSLAETVEHVVLTDRSVFARLQQVIAAPFPAGAPRFDDELVAWVRGTPADLRAHGLPHPVFGVFDGIQWILFAAAHTDNHLPQLRALQARE
jgi:hypothetical protein